MRFLLFLGLALLVTGAKVKLTPSQEYFKMNAHTVFCACDDNQDGGLTLTEYMDPVCSVSADICVCLRISSHPFNDRLY